MGVAANALSIPPGEYGRKAKTQRNWRGPAQPVERVVQFETKQKTSPGIDMYSFSPDESRDDLNKMRWLHRCCMAVVSSCREVFH